MTRSEAVAELERIALNLEADLARAQTRDQHLAISQRVSEVRALIRGLSSAPAA